MSDQIRTQTPKEPPTTSPIVGPLPTPQMHSPTPLQAYHRARSHPRTLSSRDVRVLQRTVGNKGVARLFAQQRADQQHKTAPELSPAIQRKLHPASSSMQQQDDASASIHQAAHIGIHTPATRLPYAEQIQQAFGHHDVSHIQAHIGESATQSTTAINAAAYATGNHVVFAGTPDLQTAAHEAAHIVQQQSGLHLAGGIGQAHDAYEQHADAVADRVVAGQPAQDMLNRFAPGNGSPRTGPLQVQRALVPVPGQAYSVDDRDLRPANQKQRFWPVGGGGANWRDSLNPAQAYTYTYTADEEFLVVNGQGGGPYPAQRYWDVAAQQEMRKEIGVGPRVGLHIYRVGGGAARYYYTPAPGHLYQQVPTNRVRWVDTQGNFVEETNFGGQPGWRVLTDDGQRVQKHYAITKDVNRNYVLPYKLRQGFLAGLPNLFGGNRDPNETPTGTVNRETQEESLGTYQLSSALTAINAVNQGGNRLHFHEATVAPYAGPPLAPPAHPETAGTFSFKASEFTIIPATTDQDIRNRILQLFERETGEDTNVPFFSTALPDQQGQTPLQQFNLAHTIAALVAKIRQDYQSYYQGLGSAQANGVLPPPGNIERTAGYTLYVQGLQDIRAGHAAAHPQEPAYIAARNEYTNGLQHAQTGADIANNHQAYMAARNEYTAGLHDAQEDAGNANNHQAYMAARNEYTAGLHDAQADADPNQNTVAYQQGYDSNPKKRKT
jgi:hypothetical protein